MKKKEFIRTVTTLLRESGMRKPVSIPKRTYTITDDEGGSKSYTYKQIDRKEMYTIDDVTKILDACLNVTKDLIRKGDSVDIYGFGSLGVHYRKERNSVNVEDGEAIFVEGRYVPKFKFGNELRMCARVYGMSLEDRAPDIEPFYDDKDFSKEGLEEDDS